MSDAFVMTGARGVLRLSSGAVTIEHQIKALEDAVGSNPGVAFDLARALVETVCKTILADRGIDLTGREKLPQLFRLTLQCVPLLPEPSMSRRRTGDALRRTAGALRTAIDGLCQLRSQEGIASHGRDAYQLSLDGLQARFAAATADALVGFLFGCHRSYPVPKVSQRIAYGDYGGFDDHVDELHEWPVIFNQEMRPSEILFWVDQQAYHSYLLEFQSTASESIEEESRT